MIKSMFSDYNIFRLKTIKRENKIGNYPNNWKLNYTLPNNPEVKEQSRKTGTYVKLKKNENTTLSKCVRYNKAV